MCSVCFFPFLLSFLSFSRNLIAHVHAYMDCYMYMYMCTFTVTVMPVMIR